MKVHYINILLFAHALNILVNTHKKTSITQKISTTRSLCECELYAPANYDNDKEMKKVMQQFEDRTSQRFHEYDERLKTTRQKCKEQCDKESQKIILKDKLEKELMDKFSTLDTDIQNDAIPTCVCEKSMADKVEKGCLRCGYGLGTIAPTVGLIGTFVVDQLTNALTASAIAAAKEAGTKAGVEAVIGKMEKSFEVMGLNVRWADFIKPSHYSSSSGIFEGFKNAVHSCKQGGQLSKANESMVDSILRNGEAGFGNYVTRGKEAYAVQFEAVKVEELGKVTTQTTPLYNAITYSVLAIIIIVLIMVIIYLILRYRRKKKMKKKLQYIKLLEE
ncbi:rifin PIR protein, putative [Plasmodium reichenowi]|uniref:Rifin PIR protein, putative n=1 Tax=Plasmodium reichenowi TaxID=5854 RepID=A0A2P9D3X8_PLARE|nr:rifin PIR protein, putative [Plasmodium reichenowi]